MEREQLLYCSVASSAEYGAHFGTGFDDAVRPQHLQRLANGVATGDIKFAQFALGRQRVT